MEQPKQEKTKLQKIAFLIPIILFLAFVSLTLVRTAAKPAVRNTVKETRISFNSLGTLTDSFEDVLEENIYGRYSYINLNGLMAKTLGIHSLNNAQKLANGYLAAFEQESDYVSSSGHVIELDQFLKERDIDFVYLLAPSKTGFYGAEFAPGYGSTAKLGFDKMIAALEDAGVTAIDMNAWYEENGWTMEDVYYRTDHHWMPQSALAAARVTMETLSDQGIIDGYDERLLEEDSYNIVTRENWFLGSHGKRVGIFYAGTDDFETYLPNFPTDYTFAGLKRGTTTWDYQDNPLDLRYLEEKNYFVDAVYCTYLYADNPVQRITNSEASINQKVLVIGDSFRRVWEYFLTTQFQDIYSVDPRTYTDGTVAELIEDLQPDIVLMCTKDILNARLYKYGIEDYQAAVASTSGEDAALPIESNVALEAQGSNENHFAVLCNELEPGQTYTLTVDSTAYSGGEDLFVQMTLQDLSDNTAVYNRYFEANSGETQKWIFTTPEDESGSYSVYLYAGTKGHTAGTSAEVTGVALRKGIFEEQPVFR